MGFNKDLKFGSLPESNIVNDSEINRLPSKLNFVANVNASVTSSANLDGQLAQNLIISSSSTNLDAIKEETNN